MSEDIYINRRKIFDNLQYLDWWAFGLLGEAGHEDETRLELTRWLSEQPMLSLEEIDGLILGGCRSNLDGYLTDSYCAVLANAFISYPEQFVKRMSGENMSDPERRQIVSLTAYGCAAPEETFERALEAAEEITGDPLRYTERELVWGEALAAAIRGQ
ncbi:MAG: hypothetical protein IKR21_05770 [Oscillospiraceae bacterium]|nr:hypothetical protein [Oscillospiraceae bacterium]